MGYLGAGTRSSPIALDDDSEDEVVYQLSSSRPHGAHYTIRDTPESQQQSYHGSETYERSSSARSWSGDPTWTVPDPYMGNGSESKLDFASNETSYPPAETFDLRSYSGGNRAVAEFATDEDESPLYWPQLDLDAYATNKKRKRVGSFTSQDMSTPGPSRLQEVSHPSLANRLSQPESKKARKRRRRAERQAIEEARLQNSAWAQTLANSGFNGDPADLPQWEPTGVVRPSDSFFVRDSPPPKGSWPSSMTINTENSVEMQDHTNRPSHRPFLPSQASAPLAQRPPPPVPQSQPQPVSKHTLPPKPPPPLPVPPIGMKPDQDPNSKHGIFHIEKSNKEAGTDMKKRNQNSTYIPNPARTLVMEQLPKPHRNVEYIYRWSRTACGALPIHLFIDVPSAKALLEFATAELARKAWSSPKLGLANLSLKSHQLKGKPREDQIKVWWYRVDGVGAGAGVGEIEEGEIEGDSNAGDGKDMAEPQPPKETKKERKARLAREREEKKKEMEQKLAVQQQRQQEAQQQQRQQGLHQQMQAQQQQQQQQQQPLPLPQQPMQLSTTVQEPLQAPQMQDFLTPTMPFYSPSSTPLGHSFIPNSLNALAQPFQPMLGSYFPSMLTSAFPNPGLPLWNQQPSNPTPLPQSRPQAKASTAKVTNRLSNKTAFGASLNKDGHSDNESIASSAAASTSPVLSVREKAAPVQHQPRRAGRARVIMVTKSVADVERDLSDDGEDRMDVDLEADMDTIPSLMSDPVQQPPQSSKQFMGLKSLPPKPVLASQPQKLQSQSQISSSPSLVPRSTSVRSSSPRHIARDLPLHKTGLQHPTQPQPQHVSHPQQQPELQRRSVAGSRSAHTQQKPAALEGAYKRPSPATITTASSSSSSSASGSIRSTPIPSEPKAMRVRVPAPSLAPPVTSPSTAVALPSSQTAKPSVTKEALLARQKELEERIAKSKLELAATASKSKEETPRPDTPTAGINGNGNAPDVNGSSQAVPVPTPAPVKPSMDLGQNQAMEDLLRKKVLQSQRARAAGKSAQSDMQKSVSALAVPESPPLDPGRPSRPPKSAITAAVTSSAPLDAPHLQKEPQQATLTTTSSTISLSSHSFSLDDLAVSFITQTIEGAKSQPSTPAVQMSGPAAVLSTQAPRPRQPSQQVKDIKLDLAAKQRRLEQHIAETKALMAKLTQARTKEEKDQIRNLMKEQTRLFEEESKASTLSNDATGSSQILHLPKKTEIDFNSVSSSVTGSRNDTRSSITARTTTMTHQFQITRWPVSRHDAGVLILSDDEDDEDDGDDEEAV